MNAYPLFSSNIRQGHFWPVVEACYSRTWDHYEMQPHIHNRAEIMYVLKGRCMVHLYEYLTKIESQGIRITRQWTEWLRPGEFILLDQGVLHSIEVPETSYMLNAEFCVRENEASLLSVGALANASPELMALLNSRQLRRRELDESGHGLHALEGVIQEFSRAGAPNNALADVLLAELLLCVSTIVRNASIKINVRSYIQKALDYIAGHLGNDLRISEIAQDVNIASAYLQRIFKQTMGVTLVQYINQQRIEQSKQLLMYTDDAIVDVAIASGFNSRQHFFRVFNGMTNMSPQQFRQEYRAKNMKQLFLFDNVSDNFYDMEGNRT
jgi:AraC-like DNA-binding protein